MFDVNVYNDRIYGELEWNGKTLVIMQMPYPHLDTHYKACAIDTDEDSNEEYMIFWAVIDQESVEDPCDWTKFKVEVI